MDDSELMPTAAENAAMRRQGEHLAREAAVAAYAICTERGLDEDAATLMILAYGLAAVAYGLNPQAHPGQVVELASSNAATMMCYYRHKLSLVAGAPDPEPLG